jgi:TetR/AcrR family transcriptional regulator, transcriptional repressor for nem operon
VNKRPEQPDTATRILDTAEALVQTRGFSGFSYADVASELHVTTANLHYHFGSKADLGEALVRRYRSRFFAALDAIGARPVQAPTKLSAYARIYADVLRLGRMCLCGMLAAGHETLPTPMRKEVVQFFEENERWLVGVLEQGRSEGAFGFTGPASAAARSIISGLEGAMLTARLFGDVERFESDASRLIGSAAGTTPRSRTPRAKAARRTG